MITRLATKIKAAATVAVAMADRIVRALNVNSAFTNGLSAQDRGFLANLISDFFGSGTPEDNQGNAMK